MLDLDYQENTISVNTNIVRFKQRLAESFTINLRPVKDKSFWVRSFFKSTSHKYLFLCDTTQSRPSFSRFSFIAKLEKSLAQIGKFLFYFFLSKLATENKAKDRAKKGQHEYWISESKIRRKVATWRCILYMVYPKSKAFQQY